LDGAPQALLRSSKQAFVGSYVLGTGFSFDDANAAQGKCSSLRDMRSLLTKEKNSERVFPYLGGEEINTDPSHAHTRYVIQLNGLDEAAARLEWPDLMAILERYVKGKRGAHSTADWWQFERPRPALYAAIRNLDRVIVISQATKHLAFTFVAARQVFDQKVIVFASDSIELYCLLSCRSYEIWVRGFASTLGDTLNFSPKICVETFPFLQGACNSITLGATGRGYCDGRAEIMAARNEGMTKIYNRFHDHNENDEDIQRLRRLHAAMDREVLEAYGWHDLAERAEPIFLDETNEDDHTYQGRLFWSSDFRDEVLARLLALNADRHAEEVRLGIAPGTKGKKQADEEDEAENTG
jgi:hypothetical protein